jgi:hypothetical protein
MLRKKREAERHVERKAHEEKMMAEWEADRRERNADFEKRMSKWKADGEKKGSRP